MTPDEWLARFCEQIGTDPPSREEAEALLELAATAAHDSARLAAPLACWAAGRSGRPAAELKAIAVGIADRAD
jgi:hypothetical protein